MSQENVEVLRAFYKARDAGDMDGLRELHDPSVIMHHPSGWPEPGPEVGRDAVMRQFHRLRCLGYGIGGPDRRLHRRGRPGFAEARVAHDRSVDSDHAWRSLTSPRFEAGGSLATTISGIMLKPWKPLG